MQSRRKKNMPFVATSIRISHKVKNILKNIAKSRTLPQCQVQRAKIIIGASKGKNNQEIAIFVGMSADSVSRWRMRWVENADKLEKEEQKTHKDLEAMVKELLKDKSRSGHPCEFTEVQILKIIEIACRNPVEYGYEASHWSLPQLAKVVIELGIVESISPSSIGRFLKYR